VKQVHQSLVVLFRGQVDWGWHAIRVLPPRAITAFHGLQKQGQYHRAAKPPHPFVICHDYFLDSTLDFETAATLAFLLRSFKPIS
jgi:hypothetical protein